MVLGSSHNWQVLFPLASVERRASLFGNSPFPTASTCCPLSLHREKQPLGLLFCPCLVLGGAAPVVAVLEGDGSREVLWALRGAAGAVWSPQLFHSIGESCSPGLAHPGAQAEIKWTL